MVINRYRQSTFGSLLTDHVLIEDLVDLLGLGKVPKTEWIVGGAREFVLDNLITEFDTLIADIDPGTGYQFPYLVLVFSTK